VADTATDIRWKFLSDNAVLRDDQDRFGIHSAYAKVLFHIVQACDTPFSIALYSSWGTGKTSICNLIRELAESDSNVHYVYLDVWKYSDEPLKRWILLETHRSLTEQKVISNYEFGGRSLQSHLEFEESWEDRDKVSVNFTAVRWLGVSVLFFIGVFLIFLFLVPHTSYVAHIFTIVSAFLAVGGTATLLFEAVVKEIFKSLSGLVFERKVRHVSQKPAFSGEKFGEIFGNIVRTATGSPNSSKRIIFVFDNLDRCSDEVAVETIGVIKTYLDEPGCVYIIPCDEAALTRHIAKSYTPQADGDGHRYAKEFLNKFFQATLRLPIAAEFDIETFLDDQIRLTKMQDLPPDARDVLVLGYLGQTPRQIKRVLNDLTAYRLLAVQAEKQGLVENGALTSDLSLLTKMSVISVEWPSFLDLLADDPELWADLSDKMSTGEAVDDKRIPAKLRSFLHATRHVSSNADIRPFIYLKRVQYERNQAVATAVENNLRKGESTGFLELLEAAKSPSEQEGVVRIATDLTRHWLDATPPRDVFLKNSTSVLLKAAGTITTSRSLDLAVSNLLDHILSTAKPAEIAEIVSLPDLFSFSPTISTGQKERCLERIASLFDPAVPLGKSHTQYWRQLLEHEAQLSPSLQSTLKSFLEERYGKSEPDALQLLFDAARRKTSVPDSDLAWVVSSSILSSVANKLTFLDDEVDAQRISVLTTFQSQMQETSRSLVANSIVQAVQGSRSRAFDVQARNAIAFLLALLPAGLEQSNLDTIAAALTEQVSSQGNLSLKAPWLGPLIRMRSALSASAQAAVDSLYRPYLQDPTDPAALVLLLTAMTQPICSLLLAIPENVRSLHEEAQRIEARFNPTQAPPRRDEILKCFPSSILIAELGVFDEKRTWDLVLFASILVRGRQEKVADATLRDKLVAFSDRFLKGTGAVHVAALEALLRATNEHAELLDQSVANALSDRCIETLDADVERLFSELRRLRNHLFQQDRVRLVRELIAKFLEPRQTKWVEVLQKLTEDVSGDAEVSTDKVLVNDLMDYAFEAAREYPAQAAGILVNLLPRLGADRANASIDRAQDSLIMLESTGAPISQMEPYLALLKSVAWGTNAILPTKLVTFADRMLGMAKSEEERKEILSFLRGTELSIADASLASRVLALLPDDDPLAQVARAAISHANSEEIQ
jgi:hypothetical protein